MSEQQPGQQHVIVVGPDGQPVAVPADAVSAGEDDDGDDLRELTDLVEQPAKVMRIAQAQLVGWLEGLFHGIQTAIYAQQVSARAQFEQMRRALPGRQGQGMGHPGMPGQPGMPQAPGAAQGDDEGQTQSGMYL